MRILKQWLATKPGLTLRSLLFPISGRVRSTTDRKTFKMIRLDLAVARKKWLKEAKTPEERKARDESDFLRYRDSAGRFVHFHSLRHYFITSLNRAGVTPQMAQSLARHSDIRLTMGVYTHLELGDQSAAIGALAGPENPRRT